ncbi:MAG: DUF4838 domain-containing protein [Clostridiales bacterium]|nr:DUF4838 domain-containing protein [Clostridiales bacterium]
MIVQERTPIHRAVAAETGRYITDAYKIVAARGKGAKFAADEVRHFLREAAGLDLPIVSDADARWATDAKYLAVGRTAQAKSAGVVFDAGLLGENGFIVRTVGDSVFMGGAGSFGDMYAAYEFLACAIGFEAFNQRLYRFRRGQKALLPQADITEVPDFQWRCYDISPGTQRARRALRLNCYSDLWMGGWHSSFKFLPKDKHLRNPDQTQNHPAWYSQNEAQLCYTAHGDRREYEALLAAAVESVKREIIQFPDRCMLGFTQEDAWELTEDERWCTCPACAAEKQKYGSNAAVMIKFVNDLGEKIETWIKTNDDGVPHDRQVQLSFFAYTVTKDAPVKAAADGGWEPIDASVVCRDNVTVYFAPIGADYTKPFNARQNGRAVTQADQWRAVSKELYVWLYETNFHHYLYPYNSWGTYGETYRFFRARNVSFLFNEGQFNQEASTGFNDLKIYINSKLLWDADADEAAVTDRYFAEVFGPAAKTMRTYFEEIKERLAVLAGQNADVGKISFKINEAGYWPKQVLDKWRAQCETALAEAAPLKGTDARVYDETVTAVTMESMFPRYALITLHGETYPPETLRDMKRAFAADAARIGLNRLTEPIGAEKLLAEWGQG